MHAQSHAHSHRQPHTHTRTPPHSHTHTNIMGKARTPAGCDSVSELVGNYFHSVVYRRSNAAVRSAEVNACTTSTPQTYIRNIKRCRHGADEHAPIAGGDGKDEHNGIESLVVELSPSCPACGKSPSLPAISPSPCAVGEAATAHTTPERQYKAHRAAASVHSVSLQCCALAPRGSGMAGGCERPGGLWLRCRLLSFPNTVLHSHTQLARVDGPWGQHLRDGRVARG